MLFNSFLKYLQVKMMKSFLFHYTCIVLTIPDDQLITFMGYPNS